MIYYIHTNKEGGVEMYIVTVLNKRTQKTFEIEYNSLYKLEQFKRKCKYSKKIQIISISKN